MNRFQRRPIVRWTLRLVLALGASELGLAMAAAVLERFPGVKGGAKDAERAIVCIGDSNTAGVGARGGRSYPDQLGELLRAGGFEEHVVNLGVGGFSTRQIVDRLEREVGDARPRAVVFLGGYNDSGWDPLLRLAPSSRTLPERLVSWLARLRTWRVASTALRLLRGDHALATSGGAPLDDGDPQRVPTARWDDEYARARAIGFRGIVPWFVRFAEVRQPARMAQAWRDLVATPEFATRRADLRFPISAYEWEIALLSGSRPAALPVAGVEGEALDFALYTGAWSRMASGDLDGAQRELHALHAAEDPVYASWETFVSMEEAWASLLARDYAEASKRFESLRPQVERLPTSESLFHVLAGGALACVLGDDSSTLAGCLGTRAEKWREYLDWPDAPNAREWMLVAEWIDAKKRRDREAEREVVRRVEGFRDGTLTTPATRWLASHRDATFDAVRSGLPLEPPRTSWLGPRHCLFREFNAGELDGVLEQALGRLEEFARARDAAVVILTYLDYEDYEPRSNPRLRAAAARHGWPLVDLRALYSNAELAADEKRRYFSPDRGHPNEAGYGLVAKAVLDELVRREIVHRR